MTPLTFDFDDGRRFTLARRVLGATHVQPAVAGRRLRDAQYVASDAVIVAQIAADSPPRDAWRRGACRRTRDGGGSALRDGLTLRRDRCRRCNN